MEQKFLMYVLYITLVELREKAHANKDNRAYYLCDMLHNVPFALASESETHEAYQSLLSTVEHLQIGEWLKARQLEFQKRYPEYGSMI